MDPFTHHLLTQAFNNAWANHHLLAHLFQHQLHARGQAHAMLSANRVAPPQLDDFFCANDAPVRAAGFRALGFCEAAIWPVE